MKAKTRKLIESNGYKVYGTLVSVNGALYPLPLVKGNSKLGKSVWHSSTLPTDKEFTVTDPEGNEISEKGTCPMTCRGCYGCTGNYRFNDTKYALMMRTKLLREHMGAYFIILECQLIGEGVEHLRIHATGDFITGEANGFYDVLSRHSEISAWTYTKVKNDPDIDRLNSLENCNVVESVIPGCGFNFGHIDYIMWTYEQLKTNNESVYICRCGIDPEQHCSDCNGCSKHKYVLFIEHSTNYKAKKDPLYMDIVNLIENQEN